ncbi:MAG: hypothetical protein HGA45_23670 [Chloroflexales bacterium]|nr:hypothetical protein [Chloroflexales bacterium]
MLRTPPHYQVYLLRIWEERGLAPTARPVWRLSLEAIASGRKYGFGSSQELLAFLERQIAASTLEGPADEEAAV